MEKINIMEHEFFCVNLSKDNNYYLIIRIDWVKFIITGIKRYKEYDEDDKVSGVMVCKAYIAPGEGNVDDDLYVRGSIDSYPEDTFENDCAGIEKMPKWSNCKDEIIKEFEKNK